MRKYFEKMFFWEEFLCYYSKDKLNFIGNSSSEKRSENAEKINKLNEQCKCTYFFLDYDYEEDLFKCNEEKYDLKSQTFIFLQKLDKSIPVMLNITSMNLRLMGTLLFNIKKFGFKEVYCLYTEPLRYCKNIDGSDREEFVDRFDLYKKFRGIEPIPGFLRANDDKLNEKWIAFLGFDGKRVEQINDRYDFADIVPVITLPSYKPGWQNYALQENIDIIKSVERKPEYIIANSFLSAYDYLEKMKETYPKTYLRVTPLGTKINALGAILFCLNNVHNVELLYDNPKEEGKISTECGKTYIFDISEMINQ
jgi:hypothetical protein